ncbi:Zinc-regulated transporter 3 [Escovopsis weberi]|uniref:Zinc-regulated transporter 3 n=1 Tax=Escovopsis weberi TaxID=150374 RepID=A0A0M8N2B9_ESCWE|nr:Zinc-regulated transporter 3 [Escovopsis weberi]
MATMDLDNDTRGWILCLVSGAACIVGASVICVDIIVDLLPGKKNFRIQESNAFLACSLSLSFGVLLYSALCSMLPESREYFKTKGWSDQSAGLVMMLLFATGFVGIQAVSRVLHQHIPSHVVDCDHSHSEVATHDSHDHTRGRGVSRSSRARKRPSRPSSAKMPDIVEDRRADMSEVAVAGDPAQRVTESTPLLDAAHGTSLRPARYSPSTSRPDGHKQTSSHLLLPSARAPSGDAAADRRPSMYKVQKRVMSFVKDTKCNCDESGSCYGYTDPCAQECFKHLSSRASSNARDLPVLRTTTTHFHSQPDSIFADHPAEHAEEFNERPVSPHFRAGRSVSRDTLAPEDDGPENEECFDGEDRTDDVEAQQQQHHHHVPTNAFLSIGLQTSLAITLHKFPEGFITFATNHTNPDLGFNVFLALFVHNITDGFAMCLPLYMALGSRLRAMGWTFLLGGLSQPIGAGVAALWLKLAKQTNLAPGPIAYACLFAMTAGIMVSVALQLFVEALSLNHNRNLCILFAFIGMALLGSSNALFTH